MDELEFQRILSLFPVVRPRDFNYADLASSRQSTAQPPQNELQKWQDAWHEEDKKSTSSGFKQHDAFWDKLKMAAEKKIGATEAERFCKAFERTYEKLVYEVLSSDAAKSFLSSSSGDA